MPLQDHTNTSMNTSKRVRPHSQGQGRRAATTTQVGLNCPETTPYKEHQMSSSQEKNHYLSNELCNFLQFLALQEWAEFAGNTSLYFWLGNTA